MSVKLNTGLWSDSLSYLDPEWQRKWVEDSKWRKSFQCSCSWYVSNVYVIYVLTASFGHHLADTDE